LDQLELTLDELETAATEDELAVEMAATKTTKVASFTRKRPSRQPFPEHLPHERVIVPGPVACACCGAPPSRGQSRGTARRGLADLLAITASKLLPDVLDYLPGFRDHLDGIIAYTDQVHLSATMSVALAEALTSYLDWLTAETAGTRTKDISSEITSRKRY
jgi:hypothetical protein